MRRPRTTLLVLALVATTGLGGMLLTSGAWDALFFLLAAFPLALGGARAWALRDAGKAGRRSRSKPR